MAHNIGIVGARVGQRSEQDHQTDVWGWSRRSEPEQESESSSVQNKLSEQSSGDERTAS